LALPDLRRPVICAPRPTRRRQTKNGLAGAPFHRSPADYAPDSDHGTASIAG
jgi:hypothetical protein